ncbi:MAG: glycosyltransferase family 2 protein [Halofilum sp. (in: g-proteobacteria)]
MEIVFWVGAGLVGYAYVGYPALLWLWACLTPAPPPAGDITPRVSIIVAAYNEAGYIEDKLRNALAQDYPREALEVIAVSDGSDDGTADIARGIDDDRLRVIELPRGGKARALNAALAAASGEIVVFTDANVFFDPDAVRRLAGHFAAPDCGAVTGLVELVAMESSEPLGEGAYMRYERFLQEREARIATMIGTDGALFAARRALLGPLPPEIILDDFWIAARIADQGYAVRYDHRARGFEWVPAAVAQEFRRKVRIAAGGFQVLPHLGFLRHPLRRPTLSLFFVSHKLLRWLAPFPLLALFISSALLANQPLYLAAFCAQLAFYLLAGLGATARRARRFTLVYTPYYFAALNAALLVGLLRYLGGRQSALWRRVSR